MTWTHRPALDGLRSVAVYLVLLFHAGLSAVDGGFVGVDLFFVLSGFLVASILLTELDETGRVRLWRFYARRVRRLLPAALVVVVLTAGLFVLVAPSVRRLPLVGDAQASLLYVANWRFLAQDQDYFGADIDRSPYLHFWSLSIEEQFYVVFPLVLLALFAAARRWRPALVVGVTVLFLASLTSQLVSASTSAGHAYYGTDARAYQLLAGVLAAMWWRAGAGARSSGSGAARGIGRLLAPAGLLGLGVLGSGLLDVSASLRGMAATVASVAAVLGLMVHASGASSRLLARPTPVYLGRISYGTYLWHWPVILVLGEVLDTSPWAVAALTAVLATALAALSFQVLEHPVRTAGVLGPHAAAVVAVGLVASVLAALVVVPPVLESPRRPALVTTEIVGGGVGQRVPDDINWFRYADDRGPDDTYCTVDDVESCVVVDGDEGGMHVALVGDSHARMLAPTIEGLARQKGWRLSLHVIQACPWQHEVLRDDLIDANDRRCVANRDDLYGGLLETMGVDLVLLTQLARDRGTYLDVLEPDGVSADELDAFNLDAMATTLEEIGAAGARGIVFRPIIEVPDELANPLECLSGATRTGQCRVPVPLEAPPSDAFTQALGASGEDVASVTINDLLCPDAPLCEPLMGRIPVWRDRNHYSPAAIESLRDEILERLEATGLLEGS